MASNEGYPQEGESTEAWIQRNICKPVREGRIYDWQAQIIVDAAAEALAKGRSFDEIFAAVRDCKPTYPFLHKEAR